MAEWISHGGELTRGIVAVLGRLTGGIRVQNRPMPRVVRELRNELPNTMLRALTDRRKIDLDESIKRIGIYPIKIRLMAGLEPMVNVVVEGQEGEIELPADPDAEE